MEFLIIIPVLFILIINYAANYGDNINVLWRRPGQASSILGTFEKMGKSNESKIPRCPLLAFLCKIIPTKPKFITLIFFFSLSITFTNLTKTYKK